MSAEKGFIPPVENRRTAPQTTVRELIGAAPYGEVPSLGLFNAPLYVTSRKMGPHSTEYAALLHVGLNTERFFDFLLETAPYTEFDTLGGVKEDWKLIDVGSRSQYTRRLVGMHETLGASWEEFKRHRKDFIGAIDLPTVPLLNFGKMLSSRNVQARRLASKAMRMGRKGGEDNFIEVPNYEKGGRTVYVRARADVSLERDSGHTFSIETEEALGTGHFSVNEKDAVFSTDRSTVIRRNNLLVPVLHWKNRDGERKWINPHPMGELEDRLQLRTLPPEQKPDTLVGLLTLLYVSPEIVIQMPKAMTLQGSNFDQGMGAAQIPVLALIREKSLLQSRLLPAAEQFAKNAA